MFESKKSITALAAVALSASPVFADDRTVIDTLPHWINSVSGGHGKQVQTFMVPGKANVLESWELGVRSGSEQYTLSIYEWDRVQNHTVGDPVWMSGPHNATNDVEFVEHEIGVGLARGVEYGVVVDWGEPDPDGGTAYISNDDGYPEGYMDFTDGPTDIAWFYGDNSDFEMAFRAVFSNGSKLRKARVTRGTLVSGDKNSLMKSDNDRLQARARVRSDGAQETRLLARFKTRLADPCALDLIIESKINQSGGTAKVYLKNWNTGKLSCVKTYSIGENEKRKAIDDLGSRYISDDGVIVMYITHRVNDPQHSNGFKSYFDHIQARVR